MLTCEQYIYNKLVELQWQLPHPDLYMYTGDTIQIEAPDFDPDINEALPTSQISTQMIQSHRGL